MFKSIISLVLIFEIFQFVISIKDKEKTCLCHDLKDLGIKRFKRIIGSNKINYKIPWQVSITWNRRYLKKEFRYLYSMPMCSGVILNEKWILTSAKCLEIADQLTLLLKGRRKSVNAFLIGFGSNGIQ